RVRARREDAPLPRRPPRPAARYRPAHRRRERDGIYFRPGSLRSRGRLGSRAPEVVTETIHDLTIERLQVRIRASELSPVAVVEACLARIDAQNRKLNAFATVLADSALEAAREAEAEIRAGQRRGPLHGLPVGIKDFYGAAGIRPTAGFEHFRNRVPRSDATTVAKLKNAGAIIVGKTNMHRLGMGTTGLDSCFGPVINPLNAA